MQHRRLLFITGFLTGVFIVVISTILMNQPSGSLYLSYLHIRGAESTLRSPKLVTSYHIKSVGKTRAALEISTLHFNRTEVPIVSTTQRIFSHKRIEKKHDIVFYKLIHHYLKIQAKSVNMSRCHFNNCFLHFHENITEDAINASAVIFQGNRAPDVLPRRMDDDQMFVYLDAESPQYLRLSNLSMPKFKNFFNMTMTYRMDSDIPYPYGLIVSRRPPLEEEKESGFASTISKIIKSLDAKNGNTKTQTPKNYSDIFHMKNSTAAWLVSHCKTASKREIYVEEMRQHIDVDIFGGCTKIRCPRGTEFIEKNYKFYIAFENSKCFDYITEKVFYWYPRNIIVVVRGTLNYEQHLPKGTFINAADFATPEKLAAYLTYLENNETAYTEILKYKDTFRVVTQNEIDQNVYCKLCERLNTVQQRTSIPDIHAWWSEGQCESETRRGRGPVVW